jgi:hypothetical protein
MSPGRRLPLRCEALELRPRLAMSDCRVSLAARTERTQCCLAAIKKHFIEPRMTRNYADEGLFPIRVLRVISGSCKSYHLKRRAIQSFVGRRTGHAILC